MQTRCLRGRWRGTRPSSRWRRSGRSGAIRLWHSRSAATRRWPAASPHPRRTASSAASRCAASRAAGVGADSPGPLPRFPRASRSGWGSRKLIVAAAFPLDSATAAAPSEEALPESPSVPHDSCRSWAPPAPWSPRSGSVMDARLAGTAVWLPRPAPPRCSGGTGVERVAAEPQPGPLGAASCSVPSPGTRRGRLRVVSPEGRSARGRLHSTLQSRRMHHRLASTVHVLLIC